MYCSKKKFSIKNFFRKCDQICRKLRIWSHLLKKSLKKKRHFLCIDGSSEPINPWHFLKELNKIFKMHLNILSRLWLIVCCHQQKIKKMRHFGHFNDYNFGSKQDKQKNEPVSLINSFSPTSWYILFSHFKNFKIQFHRVASLHQLVSKIHIYLLKMILSSQLTKIFFFYRKLLTFGIEHFLLTI